MNSTPIYEEIEAQPIPANLIEFPREIIATRRMRPRLGDGPGEADPQQLSIFEVDPNTVSTDPMGHRRRGGRSGVDRIELAADASSTSSRRRSICRTTTRWFRMSTSFTRRPLAGG